MGMNAEFEEKEFETLANAAFVADALKHKREPRLFSPGQVLEERLGFDFATHVAPHSALRRLLFGATPGLPGTPRKMPPAQGSLGVPSGMLRPGVPGNLPLLNLFLQYKRPQRFSKDHLSGLWPRGQEHLRFDTIIRPRRGRSPWAQVAALCDLERLVQHLGIVRYACPSTGESEELYRRFHQQTLIETSTFVAPRHLDLGGGRFHKHWLFSPTDVSQGMPNPSGSLLSVEGGTDMKQLMRHELKEVPVERFVTSLQQTAEGSYEVLEELGGWKDGLHQESFHGEVQRLVGEFERPEPFEHDMLTSFVSAAVIARETRTNWMILAR